MKKLFTVIFVIISILFCENIGYTKTKPALDTVLLVDGATNITLRSENANKLIAPASFTKLMTIAVVLDALKNKKISLNQQVPITHDIWMKGGAPSGTSTMFAALNSNISVDNLLKGLVIDNANDAALALAILIAGNEQNFTKLMNIEAKRIGLQNSYFLNATGLPEENMQQTTTLKDIIMLLQYLRKHHKLYVNLSQQTLFTWNKITQNNKNFLLKKNSYNVIGLAGITAYNKIDNFMFVGCAMKENRIIYIAFTNASSKNNRIQTSYDLLNWAYNNFTLNVLFAKNSDVLKIPVFAGKKVETTAIAQNNIYGLESKLDKNFTQLKVKYLMPLIAPIYKNEKVGEVLVYSKNQFMSSNALIAKYEIKSSSFFKKFKAALYQITIGWFTNLLYYKMYNI